MSTKRKRPTWMRELKAFPMNGEGTMTQETARAQKSADTRDRNKRYTLLGSIGHRSILHRRYADALGMTLEEADFRIGQQHRKQAAQ